MKRTYSLDLFPYGTSITSQYFFDSQCQDSTKSFDSRQGRWHTFVCSSNSPEEQVRVFHTVKRAGQGTLYTECWHKSSEYQPMPPELASSMGSKAKVSQYTISAKNLLQTEELMRRVAIYGSITVSLVVSIKFIPEEARDKVVQEQIRIMHKSSQKAIA